tara:strand:- start:710 stop:2551 length:1842 start_codon:yes stop_codon:yes gene_type:complete
MGFLNTVISRFSPDLAKASGSITDGPPATRQPKAVLWDPLSLAHSLGYKDRKTSLSYDLLKKVAHQLSVVAAIINTRVNQVATFTSPFRQTNNVGFEVKHKDREHRISAREKSYIMDLESFIVNCGRSEQNPYTARPRDNFDQFTRKVIRDRMTFDALTFEKIPDRKGDIFEFIAVDASTIRLAADHNVKKKDLSNEEFENIKPFINNPVYLSDFDFPRAPKRERGGKQAGYVQVWQGSIVRAFTHGELAYGVANPRTDVYVNGYGLSELELLLDTITSQLWAEQYNRNFFKQGAAPKGLLNIRGENIPPEQLEAFKRSWQANISGVENSWKVPVLQSEEVQYVNLQTTNLEMEYSRWMEYLIKLICSVFLISPEEIGFEFGGGMQQPMFETNNEWKLKASKDRGLRPLLKYYADILNRDILDLIDDRYYLDFVGLDELTEKERIELRERQAQYFRTVNEIRKDEDLEPDEDGDIILNPAYLQWKQMQHQWETEKEQRKEQKEMQERQMQMQEKQMQMQQQMQQQQMAAQQKQVQMQHSMQHRQLSLQEQQAQAAAQQESPEQQGQENQGGEEQMPPIPEIEGEQPQEEGQVSPEDIKSFLDSLPTSTLESMV